MGSKGKAPAITDDAPWVEKYRPKTLDDVAAHKEIIDTSMYYRDSQELMESIFSDKMYMLYKACASA